MIKIFRILVVFVAGGDKSAFLLVEYWLSMVWGVVGDWRGRW
ncbi:MAG TPA: hypothetical protein VFE50_03905 [Cyclobacteriaceae bacterium]|nr:hypothetical protein [Cyclobacteriaceae bacterium]